MIFTIFVGKLVLKWLRRVTFVGWDVADASLGQWIWICIYIHISTRKVQVHIIKSSYTQLIYHLYAIHASFPIFPTCSFPCFRKRNRNINTYLCLFRYPCTSFELSPVCCALARLFFPFWVCFKLQSISHVTDNTLRLVGVERPC